MREMASREIDGHTYQFHQFGATESTRYLIRLFKIIGKPLAVGFNELMKGGDFNLKNAMTTQFTGDMIGQAVDALVSCLDEGVALDLIETMTARDHVLCDGKKVVFNSHYEARLPHMFKVLAAALEVQYGNFFGDRSESPAEEPPPTKRSTNRGPIRSTG